MFHEYTGKVFSSSIDSAIVTSMKATIRGRVRNTRLSKTKPLMPLFEAVINAFQSIAETGAPGQSIQINVNRETGLLPDKRSPIVGFSITDTGRGFTDANFDSFDTVDSDLKQAEGGKGLGRFVWLVAFDRVEIESDYRNVQGELKRRTFSFMPGSDVIDPPAIKDSESKAPRTVVRLQGFREPYRTECPRRLEVIAHQIIGHFLHLFLDRSGPAISLIDSFDTIDLRQYYRENFDSSATQHTFEIGQSKFAVKGFFLKGGVAERHELIFAADSREVITERLWGALAGLPQKLQDNKGNKFTYTAFVESSFLNAQVQSDRTGFAFPAESEDPNDITLKAIREAVISNIRKDLEPFLTEINQAKRDAIIRFVAEEAPHYRWVAKHIENFIDDVPAEPSKTEMETVLHHEQYKREVELRQESHRILSQTVDNPQTYYAELDKFAEQYNELGMSALAQYIAHRRIILQLFERAISQNLDDGSFSKESVVHNLVFPMKSTSDDIPPDRQNLWIIDERLTHHSFLTSDVRITDMRYLENPSRDRPDILIFNHPLAFTDGSQPLNSMVIVEFKRPDRGDYKEDPVEQVYRLVDDIRTGNFRDSKGLAIQPANTEIPAYCYVICDITPQLKARLKILGATPTPDKQGYFGYNSQMTAYYEVISYSKLLADATKRNRALFELQLPS